MMFYLAISAVVFLVWVLCKVFSNPSSKFYILDQPNERSLHHVPKPRSGGIAIFVVVSIAWLIIIATQDVKSYIYYFSFGLILIFIISYFDDKYSVSQVWRLLVHIAVAVLLIIGGIGFSGDLSVIEQNTINDFVFDFLTIIFVVWCINLYNFMDGMDGFAGGMGFIGFACFAWLGWWSGNNLFGFMAAIIAAANLGFLLHNFPPAKIFMGDAGSVMMGYLLAFFSLWGLYENIFTWWVPILIFSLFFVDATVTLIKRLLLKEKIWQAHKSHNYQKLVQMGWGHRKTVVCSYVLMLTSASTVIAMHMLNSEKLNYILLILWTSMYILIISIISYLWSRTGDLR